MGLVSFVQGVGRKVGLFGGRAGAEAEHARAEAEVAAARNHAAEESARVVAHQEHVAADIKAAILSYVPVRHLVVTYDGHQVRLTGTAHTQTECEKAVLVAGNTEGVASVDDRLEVVAPQRPALFHAVAEGDTLSDIAHAKYGVMRMYDAVFEANEPMLEHPDRIYPGQLLRIPHLPAPVHVVRAGETLGTIAEHWYGDANRYPEIAAANHLEDPDELVVGQSLKIPTKGPAAA